MEINLSAILHFRRPRPEWAGFAGSPAAIAVKAGDSVNVLCDSVASADFAEQTRASDHPDVAFVLDRGKPMRKH
jgi:hypothetical protein